ncbi:MAG: hypothetical protein HYR60_07205 [Acidobacteria bacterium]|nr:hypothetical protein [Acidobacteriota bacterium]
MRWLAALLVVGCLAAADSPFRVKYVASGAVYLDAGRDAGLAEGRRLTVKRLKPGEAELSASLVGEIVVTSVAASSAVCEIHSKKVDFEIGDLAFLSPQDAEMVRMLQASKNAHKYAQVVGFTEGDPIEEEARQYVPRPKLPEINRVRGTLGFEFNSIRDRDRNGFFNGAGPQSMQNGILLRADVTRINGSYWNLTGYWRGRFNSRTSGQQTLTDLLSRTYHIGMFYNNPQSKWVAGFGRLFVPYASSLNTIDGGYFGRRLNRIATAGIFAGSTPDPTAWNYDPRRQIAGAFTNFDAGSFENVRYTSTLGLAMTRLAWKAERQFAFFENGLFFKRYFSVYHNLEADQLVRGRLGNAEAGVVVSRSFLTARVQPHRIISFDLSHNYFRTVPTFDLRLLGTGLLDKLLFQGLSGGVRLDLPARISLYTNLGRSDRAGDARASWNRMYGLAFLNLLETGLRLDLRHSQFDSSFGRGRYDTVSLSRDIGERLRVDLQIGEQDFRSALTQQNRARFLNTTVDWFLLAHYYCGGGVTLYRGQVQNYDQIFFHLGYRF